ncbi:MAG: phosphate ABC transporter permease subunit PstC [Verrucomicrobiia bacterium]
MLTASRRFRVLGWNSDDLIRLFFQGNALVAILVLGLITVFLFREGLGFFPQYQKELQLYRKSGLEFVEVMRQQVEVHRALARLLFQVEKAERKNAIPSVISQQKIAFRAYLAQFRKIIVPLIDLEMELEKITVDFRDRYQVAQDKKERKEALLKAGKFYEAEQIKIETFDFQQNANFLKGSLPRYHQINRVVSDEINRLINQAPHWTSPKAAEQWDEFRESVTRYLSQMPHREKQLEEWDAFQPVPWIRALTGFLLGREWITQSFWNDFYGILPLLTGSFLIALVALALAMPLGIGAAIYVSQIASKTEQKWIKPSIEFIATIPSVVLGFFGVVVLGEGIRWLSQQEFLSWVPFFPIHDRLNIFTAGCLLGFMAVPTIFTLAEDALNNVPRIFKEASFALGANSLQTILKIMVPAALSGIIAAILLGFGRVIGETMVVLLVAGNRIAIPDFTQGLGVFFQPAHTMTGIIAQEMGEVVRGSLHYRALFMVGILLFLISLIVNYFAQFLVKRFKISIG